MEVRTIHNLLLGKDIMLGGIAFRPNPFYGGNGFSTKWGLVKHQFLDTHFHTNRNKNVLFGSVQKVNKISCFVAVPFKSREAGWEIELTGRPKKYSVCWGRGDMAVYTSGLGRYISTSVESYEGRIWGKWCHTEKGGGAKLWGKLIWLHRVG